MSAYTERKSWLKSTTIHGLIVAAIPAIVSVSALLFGGDTLGEQDLRDGIEAAVTLTAIGMAAYGRWKANTNLE